MVTRVIDRSVTVEATTAEWRTIGIALAINRPDVREQIRKAIAYYREDAYGDATYQGDKPDDSKTRITFAGVDADAVEKAIRALGY